MHIIRCPKENAELKFPCRSAETKFKKKYVYYDWYSKSHAQLQSKKLYFTLTQLSPFLVIFVDLSYHTLPDSILFQISSSLLYSDHADSSQ